MSEITRTKSANEKFCADCGEIINIKAEICPKCGVRQMSAPLLGQNAPNGKNKLAGALLAFFLGGLGIHKFYLGQTTRGILYLIFFWTVIPSILAIIDSILLLVMSDDDFNKKYGER